MATLHKIIAETGEFTDISDPKMSFSHLFSCFSIMRALFLLCASLRRVSIQKQTTGSLGS